VPRPWWGQAVVEPCSLLWFRPWMVLVGSWWHGQRQPVWVVASNVTAAWLVVSRRRAVFFSSVGLVVPRWHGRRRFLPDLFANATMVVFVGCGCATVHQQHHGGVAGGVARFSLIRAKDEEGENPFLLGTASLAPLASCPS
jgi:hypothetical protein